MRRELAFISCCALCSTSACTTEATLRFFEQESREVPITNAGGAGHESCRELGDEVCNFADDDCNGEVDEGCDHTIAWRPQADGPFLGHADYGSGFSQVCDTGSLLTGMRLGFGDALNQAAALCSQVGVSAKTADGATAYSVTIGPQFSKSLVPAVSEDPSNEVADLSCPEGLVASMLEGNDDPERHILDVRIRCAPLFVNADAVPIALELDRSLEEAVEPLVCATCSAPSDYAFAAAIPEGQVPRRLFGGVGVLINRIGLGTTVARVAKN